MSNDESAKRFIEPLPSKPSLEKQQKLAKRLVRGVWAGDADAVERFGALHPDPPAPAEAKLADAQLVIARGYGFSGWPAMKRKIESLTQTPTDRFVAAVNAKDIAQVRTLLEQDAEVRQRINDPLFGFGGRAVHQVGHWTALLDLLAEHGADVNAVSDWWAGGFGLMDRVDPGMVDEFMKRGVKMTVWAAARLNRIDDLRRFLDDDPALANAKGGDGMRPLHFAGSTEVIDLLIERGAEIDALDIDHGSTPAQYLVDQPDLCKRLIEHGARTDLLMACAIGDAQLVRRHLEEDPSRVRMRVSQEWLPMISNPKNGGHIYQWKLGFYHSVFQVARNFSRADALAVLLEYASPAERLLDAVWSGAPDEADAVLAEHPGLVASLDEQATRQVADAARHNAPETVRAFLDRGFPVTARGQHGATPLHWAAFHGNPDLLEVILPHDPPLEDRDHDEHATPLGWALYGAVHGWKGTSSDRYPEVVRTLLKLGCAFEIESIPTGRDDVDAVLREHVAGR